MNALGLACVLSSRSPLDAATLHNQMHQLVAALAYAPFDGSCVDEEVQGTVLMGLLDLWRAAGGVSIGTAAGEAAEVFFQNVATKTFAAHAGHTPGEGVISWPDWLPLRPVAGYPTNLLAEFAEITGYANAVADKEFRACVVAHPPSRNG